MFSPQDLEQITKHGLSLESLDQQITNFKEGFPFMPLIRSATIGDGLLDPTETDIADFVAKYEQYEGHRVKFVPASGAASRMFKKLFAFAKEFDGSSEEAYKTLKEQQGLQSMFYFLKNLDQFAFYPALKAHFEKQGKSLEEMHLKRHYAEIIHGLLEADGLGYGSLPKGLLDFHSYEGGTSRTPVEEHMVEGANYGKDRDDKVHLHFTVSPEHEEGFKALIAEKKGAYEALFGVEYVITFSQQKKSTDTIAVDLENAPFRNPDGSLLFRPAGHGALLENLNELDADIVYIKNIDNVVPDRLKEATHQFKKVIGGVLIATQEKIFAYQEQLEGSVDEAGLTAISAFVESELNVLPPEGFEGFSSEEKTAYLKEKLNRPIRACGIVKNEGEPGGGPFWCNNADGTVSLQIVEPAQIGVSDPAQKEILQHSTHFNPTDLVCSLKNFKGEKFDLTQHRDPKTGFITEKSKDGKDLKAQELPGLWNGSMSDWNTVFVVVPVITFNPVKTINDLLREQHLGRV